MQVRDYTAAVRIDDLDEVTERASVTIAREPD